MERSKKKGAAHCFLVGCNGCPSGFQNGFCSVCAWGNELLHHPSTRMMCCLSLRQALASPMCPDELFRSPLRTVVVLVVVSDGFVPSIHVRVWAVFIRVFKNCAFSHFGIISCCCRPEQHHEERWWRTMMMSSWITRKYDSQKTW